jgi:hypothetical protein
LTGPATHPTRPGASRTRRRGQRIGTGDTRGVPPVPPARPDTRSTRECPPPILRHSPPIRRRSPRAGLSALRT